MKVKRLLFSVFAIILTFNLVGCSNDKKKNETKDNSNIESNITSKDESDDNSNITSNENTTSNTNKNYITMEVKSMDDGSITKYEVDNYVQGYGVAGSSSQYYFVKDNDLYFVSASNPEVSKKVTSGALYVVWNNNLGCVAILKNGAQIPSEYSTYLKGVYTNDEKILKVTSMNDDNSKEYVVDNSAQGYGATGLSNHYYYVKGSELYYVNAANPEESKKIATGVRYVVFSDLEDFNGFVAFTSKDFKYIDEDSAYMLKTISLN